MKNDLKLFGILLLPVLLLTLFTACAAAPEPVSTPLYVPSSSRVWRHRDSRQKYTEADYQLALSFRTEGYRDQSVAEFNRSVLDWEDEEAYHKTEAALRRIWDSLPEDDPNRDFFGTTLSNTWDECSARHYEACGRRKAPCHSGSVSYETYGDIYGDRVVVKGGYADYWFDYQIPDETSLTVGRRDELFLSVETGMRAYLSSQSQQALSDEKTMEKALADELKRLLKNLSSELSAVDSEVYYDWEAPYQEELSNSGTEWETEPTSYTKEQYEQVLSALKSEGYEAMPIGEFDRRTNAVFQNDDQRYGISYLYELVVNFLPEDDSNAFFLRVTVPASLEEYQAKSQEVYTEKRCDPERSQSVGSGREEDVFGDKVTVGYTETDYSFTYRILDPAGLTVQARDRFLKSVEEAAQKLLDDGQITTQAGFKAGLEAAGKAAGGRAIEFTGCEVHYFEQSR